MYRDKLQKLPERYLIGLFETKSLKFIKLELIERIRWVNLFVPRFEGLGKSALTKLEFDKKKPEPAF